MRGFIFIVVAFVINAFLLTGCGGHDDPPEDTAIRLSPSEVEVNVNSTIKLEAKFNRKGYSSSDLVWESDNPVLASVSSVGTVTGNLRGETTVRVKTPDGAFSNSCRVIVNPTNFLYKEPLIAFGANPDYVRANEERKFLEEVEEGLIFKGENSNVQAVLYVFEEGKLVVSGVVLEPTEFVASQVVEFLFQRYVLLGELDDGFLWTDGEKAQVLLAVDETLGLVVLYSDLSNATAESTGKYLVGHSKMDEIASTNLSRGEGRISKAGLNVIIGEKLK